MTEHKKPLLICKPSISFIFSYYDRLQKRAKNEKSTKLDKPNANKRKKPSHTKHRLKLLCGIKKQLKILTMILHIKVIAFLRKQ